MMDPVLIGGVVLLLAALFIGFKLVVPGLRENAQSSHSAQGFNDAKARMVDSTTQLIEKRSGNSLQVKLEKSGSQLRSGEWLLGVVATSLVLASLGLLPRWHCRHRSHVGLRAGDRLVPTQPQDPEASRRIRRPTSRSTPDALIVAAIGPEFAPVHCSNGTRHGLACRR